MAAAGVSRGSCPRYRRAGLSIPAGSGAEPVAGSPTLQHGAASPSVRLLRDTPRPAAPRAFAAQGSPRNGPFPAPGEFRSHGRCRFPQRPWDTRAPGQPLAGAELPPAATAAAPRPFHHFSADPRALAAFLPRPRCRPVSCPPAPALPQPFCLLPAPHPPHAHPRLRAPSAPSSPRRARAVCPPCGAFPNGVTWPCHSVPNPVPSCPQPPHGMWPWHRCRSDPARWGDCMGVCVSPATFFQLSDKGIERSNSSPRGAAIPRLQSLLGIYR